MLDNPRSPSTCTSTSSLGGGGDSGGVVAAAVNGWLPSEWASELQPIPDSLAEMGGLGMEDWEAIFADSAEEVSPISAAGEKLQLLSPASDLNSCELVSVGLEHIDPGIGAGAGGGFNFTHRNQSLQVPPILCIKDPIFGNPIWPAPPPPGLFFPVNLEEKSQLVRRAAPVSTVAAHHHRNQALLDQLLNAAELVEAGNSVSAITILARLNQQLPAPAGKPLLRSAFYFKEALQIITRAPGVVPPRGLATPLDVLLKLGAYKDFSKVSPLLQFTNFTCTQTLLEELRSSDRIHIIDFDIGVGGQWSSFIQELAHCRPNAAPMLKITAFVSATAHHPLELHLTRDNLYHFAADLGIPLEFRFLSLETFDPMEILCMSAGSDEAIAVNLPVGSVYNLPIPSLLRLVKQLSPKIVVSVDHGCNRSDLPFSQYFLHALQSSMVLLDSIDASGTDTDVANKIERFLLQPRIEGGVIGRHGAGDRMPPWRMLFASAGFMPVHFSNFTEAQAECLLKRVPVRGFHVEKRHASLFLHWQHRELASVSAWRC